MDPPAAPGGLFQVTWCCTTWGSESSSHVGGWAPVNVCGILGSFTCMSVFNPETRPLGQAFLEAQKSHWVCKSINERQFLESVFPKPETGKLRHRLWWPGQGWNIPAAPAPGMGTPCASASQLPCGRQQSHIQATETQPSAAAYSGSSCGLLCRPQEEAISDRGQEEQVRFPCPTCRLASWSLSYKRNSGV